MPRTCSVCKDKNRKEIETAILSGQSLRAIASQYEPCRSAITRHRDNCLNKGVIENADQEKVKTASKLANNIIDNQIKTLEDEEDNWSELEIMKKDLKDIQKEAKEKGNFTSAIAAIREQSRIYEIILKMIAEKNAEDDPYELKYYRLCSQVQELYLIISKTLNGHIELRDALLAAVDKAIDEREEENK